LLIDTNLLFDITSTADGLSEGTNIDDLERPKIRDFTEFVAISGCEFSPKSLELSQDNLRTKLN